MPPSTTTTATTNGTRKRRSPTCGGGISAVYDTCDGLSRTATESPTATAALRKSAYPTTDAHDNRDALPAFFRTRWRLDGRDTRQRGHPTHRNSPNQRSSPTSLNTTKHGSQTGGTARTAGLSEKHTIRSRLRTRRFTVASLLAALAVTFCVNNLALSRHSIAFLDDIQRREVSQRIAPAIADDENHVNGRTCSSIERHIPFPYGSCPANHAPANAANAANANAATNSSLGLDQDAGSPSSPAGQVAWSEVGADPAADPFSIVTPSASMHSPSTCGLCQQNDFAIAVRDLSIRLRSLFAPENSSNNNNSNSNSSISDDTCSDMILYGVAFGGMYEDMLAPQMRCSFMFLLANRTSSQLRNSQPVATQPFGDSLLPYGKSDRSLLHPPRFEIESNGQGYIIRVPPQILPYRNNRRNTKLFKIYGGLKIFSFAKRIIWQDAKMTQYISNPDYEAFFHKNIDETGACASFRGMPNHVNTVGKSATSSRGVRFHDHCNVLLHATRQSSPVTDSRASIERQCRLYESISDASIHHPDKPVLLHSRPRATANSIRIHSRSAADRRRPSLDSGMIDSAIILWDMRTDRCQHFNMHLSCTWLDENQCHGDRDQISFPQALRTVDVYEKHPVQPAESMARDKLFYQSNNDQPAIHIARGSCHHYFVNDNDLMQCINNARRDYDLDPKRIAIVVAGEQMRFELNSTLRHVIRPLTTRGHKVDYFLSLSTTSSKESAAEANMRWLWHGKNPRLTKKATTKYRVVTDPVLPRHANTSEVQSIVRRLVAEAGGSAREVHIDRTFDIDEEPLVKAKREALTLQYPNDDLFARFPVDFTKGGNTRPIVRMDNRELLQQHYSVQMLWGRLVKMEEISGLEYDYVIFVRGDGMWLEEFDLHELLATADPSTEYFGLSCDARIPKMEPFDMNCDVSVVARNRAGLVGEFYRHLFDDVGSKCETHLGMGVTGDEVQGCTAGMQLRWLLESNGVKMAAVPQLLIPLQPSLHVEMPTGDIVACFDRVCQSHDMPLQDHGLRTCSETVREFHKAAVAALPWYSKWMSTDSWNEYLSEKKLQLGQKAGHLLKIFSWRRYVYRKK